MKFKCMQCGSIIYNEAAKGTHRCPNRTSSMSRKPPFEPVHDEITGTIPTDVIVDELGDEK